jgi:hypothetical protein
MSPGNKHHRLSLRKTEKAAFAVAVTCAALAFPLAHAPFALAAGTGPCALAMLDCISQAPPPLDPSASGGSVGDSQWDSGSGFECLGGCPPADDYSVEVEIDPGIVDTGWNAGGCF